MKNDGCRAEESQTLGGRLVLILVYELPRQNTIASRATAYQTIGLYVGDSWNQLAFDEEWSALSLVASDSTRWDELDELAWLRLRNRLTGALRSYETIYLQVEAGLLDEAAPEWLGYGADWRVYFPYLERLWPQIRPTVGAGFIEYFEQRNAL